MCYPGKFTCHHILYVHIVLYAYIVVRAENKQPAKSFGAVYTALLPLSASICIQCSPSLGFRCCISLSADTSLTVLLSCSIIGGFSWDPAFNITLLLHVVLLQGNLFVHTHKCLSFLLFVFVFFFVFFKTHSSLLHFFPFLLFQFCLCCLSSCLQVTVLSIFLRFNPLEEFTFFFARDHLTLRQQSQMFGNGHLE